MAAPRVLDTQHKIYLVTGKGGWDCTEAVVVVAKTPEDARRLASKHGGAELGRDPETNEPMIPYMDHTHPRNPWMNPEWSTCEEIGVPFIDTSKDDDGLILVHDTPG